MKMKSALKKVPAFSFVLLLFLSGRILGQWEMAFHVASNSSAVSKTVTVYKMVNNNLVFVSSGDTRGDWTGPWNGQDGYQINGACDIKYSYQTADTPSPTISALEISLQLWVYYVRIEDKFVKLDCPESGGTLGDFILLYDVNSKEFSSVVTGGSPDVNISSPYDWTPYTINMINDFGGDRLNTTTVKGKIYFDSVSYDTVSHNGLSFSRDAITFPHTASGEDGQTVANYYRKWKEWSEDGLTTISRNITTSPGVSTYPNTATYVRRYNITYQNYFNSSDNGGTIKIRDSSKTSPCNTSIFELTPVNLEAINQYSKSIYYTFNHWELDGTNISSNNPYSYGNPAPGSVLQARFTGKPINDYRHLDLSTTINQPDTLYWNHHPSDQVTGYKIYRKVRPSGGTTGPESLIATINSRMDTVYVDYDYYCSNLFYYQVYYDVRAYYQPDGTESDPDFVSTYARIGNSIVDNSGNKTVLAEEVPSDYSIANYPNPFNPATTISYQLPKDGFVTIKIFDVLGQEIATLVNENKQAGFYNVNFDASKLTSGVYIYRIDVNRFTQSKKMLLMK